MNDHRNQTHALLRMSMCKNVGPHVIFSLLDYFGSPDRALTAPRAELAKVDGVPSDAVEGLVRGPAAGALSEELDLLEKHTVRLVPCFSDDYPKPLKELERGKPPLLRIKGTYEEQDSLCIALVGSRRCSHYGRKQASRLATQLASMGFTIISGFARGIDAAAHRGALRAGGRTIAVMGCGLAHTYPKEHSDMVEEVASNGALVSELPMDTPVMRSNFPPRNRLISGLSLGVVVVEAAKRSGSLITARWAAEHGKTVMAVPGNVDRTSSHGCHQLIRDGAILVENARDVAESLGPLSQPVKDPGTPDSEQETREMDDPRVLSLNKRERRIFELLGYSPRHIDSLVDETELPASMVSSALLTLEVKGLITQLSGSRYVRA